MLVDDTRVAAFAELRPLLFSLAYRLLGQASDAEDAVQEAWLRYATHASDVREPRAWLLRAVTRLSLDHLGSARSRRERYVGPWLPEPVLTGTAVVDDPLELVERREHDLVFCRSDGLPYYPDSLTGRFREHVKKSKVKAITLHDLRHTSAVIGLRELGEAIDEVSKRLGHTSVAFTLDTYGHLLPHRGRQTATAECSQSCH